MRPLLLALAVFLLAVSPAQEGHAVQGVDIFDTHVFQCGQEEHVRWVNDLGDIRIYQSQVWMGMYAGDVADLSFQVNTHDNILHRGNWDHYADPTGITDQIQLMNWTPNYIDLKNGAPLDFIYGCYKKGTAQIVVTLWYAK
jgi:hypothetical protein